MKKLIFTPRSNYLVRVSNDPRVVINRDYPCRIPTSFFDTLGKSQTKLNLLLSPLNVKGTLKSRRNMWCKSEVCGLSNDL